MKITFVIHSLSSMGGAERVLVTLANQLVQNGYLVSIIVLSNKELLFDLDQDIRLYCYNKTRNKFNMFKQIEFIYSALKQSNTEIVIGFVATTNILTTIAGKFAKIPVILSEHSSYHRAVTTGRGYFSGLFWRILRRICYAKADHLVILTEEDKPRYHYVKHLSIIQNPLQLHTRYLNVGRENIILAVGRLHPVKGFDMLIKAFQKVNVPGWKLVIAGEGEERVALESLIKSMKLEGRVELLGLVKDIERYYRQASIFVLSSRSEGFPVALCEAMAYGCACVAFDCPTGPSEIIENNHNGILVAPNNIEALAHEIDKLVHNEQKRTLLGQEASKIIQILDKEHIVKKWESLFVFVSKYK